MTGGEGEVRLELAWEEEGEINGLSQPQGSLMGREAISPSAVE